MATSLLHLYWLAAKISLFSFGGIYSFWAILNGEAVVACQDAAAVVSKAVTFCRGDYELVLALSPVVPGPQVNVAAILGYREHGIAGMLALLLGLLTPVALLSPPMFLLYRKYRGRIWIERFFRGTSIAVAAILIAFLGAILLRILPGSTRDLVIALVLFTAIFILSYTQRLSPVLAVAVGALAGLVFLQ